MDFGLSDDQLLLKATVRRYLEAECPTTRVRAIMESESGHDAALWEGLAGLGVPGLHVPAEHGGSGLELLDAALAAEELGWACTPGPFLACALATVALVAAGNHEAGTRWLPAIAQGDDGPGLWLVERGSPGLEVTAQRTTDMTRRVAAVALTGAPATRIATGR